MFSTPMLANIIRYYGHAMQGLMGSYLERSISTFHEAQKRFQDQAQTIYGELPKMPFMPGPAIPNVMGGYLEKGAKAVIDMQEELRNQALKLFSGFPYSAPGAAPGTTAPEPEETPAPKATRTAGTRKPRTRGK
jgi:polyhydroxyalkanoate synthesis regulator protein